MPELRWILIVAGVLLLVGIWWWESRRRAQGTGGDLGQSIAESGARSEPTLDGAQNAADDEDEEENAESPVLTATHPEFVRQDLPPIRANRWEVAQDLPIVEIPEGAEPELARPTPREELPVLVPYRTMGERREAPSEYGRDRPRDEVAEAETRQPWVRTQRMDRKTMGSGPAVPPVVGQEDLPLPQTASEEAEADTLVESQAPARAEEEGDPQAETQVEERSSSPEAGGGEPRGPERQKIVALRLVARDDRWPGDAVIHALEAEGMRFGKYSIFHRERDDGKSIFYVASMIEPGSFDLETVDTTTFPGVSIFAVLPGPVDAGTTFDMMLATARRLAQRLSGHLQDEQGSTLTAQRVLNLREEVVHFEHVNRRARAR